MLKKIFLILKKIVISGLILYAYNTINVFSSAIVPINLITLFLVAVFGFPALFCLIFFSFLI